MRSRQAVPLAVSELLCLCVCGSGAQMHHSTVRERLAFFQSGGGRGATTGCGDDDLVELIDLGHGPGGEAFTEKAEGASAADDVGRKKAIVAGPRQGSDRLDWVLVRIGLSYPGLCMCVSVKKT